MLCGSSVPIVGQRDRATQVFGDPGLSKRSLLAGKPQLSWSTSRSKPEKENSLMKTLKISALLLFAAALVLPFALTSSVEGQGATEALTTQMDARLSDSDLYNGFITRNGGGLGVAPDECTNPAVSGRSFRDNKAIFEEREAVDDGL